MGHRSRRDRDSAVWPRKRAAWLADRASSSLDDLDCAHAGDVPYPSPNPTVALAPGSHHLTLHAFANNETVGTETLDLDLSCGTIAPDAGVPLRRGGAGGPLGWRRRLQRRGRRRGRMATAGRGAASGVSSQPPIGPADTPRTMPKMPVPSDQPTAPVQRLGSPGGRPPLTGSKLEKVVIGSLDDAGKGVEAQYNPKEVTFELTVPWTEHKVLKDNQPALEFTGGGGRSMSLELLFDGYETGQSVQQALSDLAELAAIRNPDSGDDVRPHIVAVAWGAGSATMPVFRGVIESITTRCTMFLRDGTPARATCAVKIKEAKSFWKK